MALAAASTLFAAGCSAGSLGSSSGKAVPAARRSRSASAATTRPVASAKAVIAAFQAANPGITVKTEPRPGGSDGDNLVKTRLSTGEMSEVFIYNNGSLLAGDQAGAEPDPRWTTSPGRANWTRPSPTSTTVDGKLYGGPWGSAQGGAVLYNIPVYKKLGLEIPKTWDEFMKNNEAIKKAGGIAPVEQSYGETWTSQLFVLGDYHNVEAQVPDFAAKYTAGQGQVRHHPGRPGWVPAHPRGPRRRLLQQGLRLGQAERRYQGDRHGHGGALSAARRGLGEHRKRRSWEVARMSASSRCPARTRPRTA